MYLTCACASYGVCVDGRTFSHQVSLRISDRLYKKYPLVLLQVVKHTYMRPLIIRPNTSLPSPNSKTMLLITECLWLLWPVWPGWMRILTVRRFKGPGKRKLYQNWLHKLKLSLVLQIALSYQFPTSHTKRALNNWITTWRKWLYPLCDNECKASLLQITF